MSRVGHVLLLVQGALAGLVAAEALVLAVAERSLAMLALAAVAGWLALVPIVVAAGLAVGVAWLRAVGVGYELLLLVSGLVDAVVLGNGDLVAVLVGIALPLALLWTMARWSGTGSRAGSTRS
jgi:hypothetical protein